MFLDKLTPSERLVVEELIDKFVPIKGLDINMLRVRNRLNDQWYMELSCGPLSNFGKDSAYDVDVMATDLSGSPLGVALFYNKSIVLSKVHIFRFLGSGRACLERGSIKVEYAQTLDDLS